MTYRAEFEGKALVQLRGLPPRVFEALFERVVELVDAPWDAVVARRGGDPAYRQTTFGQGLGLLSFRVDDSAELCVIYDIAWIG
jgi:hypothetical protein